MLSFEAKRGDGLSGGDRGRRIFHVPGDNEGKLKLDDAATLAAIGAREFEEHALNGAQRRMHQRPGSGLFDGAEHRVALLIAVVADHERLEREAARELA